MIQLRHLRTWPLVLQLFFLVEAAQGQSANPAKKLLAAEDYGVFESLRGSGTLAPDGRWLAYPVSRSDGKDELRLRMLVTDAKEAFPYAKDARFSEDSRWLGYLVGVSEDEREKLEKAKKPVRDKFVLRDLEDGSENEIKAVESFLFSENGQRVAIKRSRPESRKKGGSDLVVRRLDRSEEMCFGNVSEYAWCEARPLLAMVIDTEDEVGGNVTIYDAQTGSLRILDSGKARFKGLVWRKDADDLTFLRVTEHDDEEDEEPSHVVLAWRKLGGAHPRKSAYDHRSDEAFPKDMRAVADPKLVWHGAGACVFFGIGPWKHPPAVKEAGKKKKPEEPAKEEKPKEKKEEPKKSLRDSLTEGAGVDVWHAMDPKIIPRQKKTAAQDRRKSHLCAFWLDDEEFVRLADDAADAASVLEGGDHVLLQSLKPYEREEMFGPRLFDAYIAHARTGKRERILERHKFGYDAGPEGRFFLYVKDGHWCCYDIQQGAHRNLTKDLDGEFINRERAVLTDESPPYGRAGWSKDGQHVLLYDRYDVWAVSLVASSAKRLTRGAETKTRYRVVDLDPEEDFIDLMAPIYFSMYGDRSKKSGFARQAPGGEIETLVWDDRRIQGLAKAKKADVYVYAEETFEDSPDIFVAGKDLKGARQATRTNPQQSDFAWGRSELIDFENERGVPLQGALFYPAGYESGKKYPMIVYIYEMVSQGVHNYSAPSERSPYNPSVFTSLGYFVYQPDIVYRGQNPGLSALECVVPAVKAVLAKGFVDARRVGLVGHSWGAYQTAFIVTRSRLFAAGVAGAPLTNMMSMSMSIYWNTGETDAWIFHESQGRMDRPFWKDVETYIANSPIFGMETLETPLLIAFGDKDGAVDWHQGIEMYNAARLAEKQLVMLVYEGENHGLRKKPNQVDYHWRIREWFGHYLQGDPVLPWMTAGVSYLDREEELKKLEKKNKKKKGKKDEAKPDAGDASENR